jgi:hypothetical protein
LRWRAARRNAIFPFFISVQATMMPIEVDVFTSATDLDLRLRMIVLHNFENSSEDDAAMKNSMMKSSLLPIAFAALLLANVPVESFVTPSGAVRVATKSPLHNPTASPFSAFLAGSGGASTSRLHESSALQVDSQERLNPSWRSICEIPIPCDTQERFDSIPAAKRVAIVSRVSVLHLTLLSCLGPFVLRGAVRSSLPAPAQVGMKLTPLLALLFTIDGLSWHACHNLLNDWQDLDDDDNVVDSFRLAYGCHALKQGFLSKPAFLRLMAVVSVPGALLTFYFRNTVLVCFMFKMYLRWRHV